MFAATLIYNPLIHIKGRSLNFMLHASEDWQWWATIVSTLSFMHILFCNGYHYLSRRAVTPGWTILTPFLALTMSWSTPWSPSSMWVVRKSEFSSITAQLFLIFCLSWSVKVEIDFNYFYSWQPFLDSGWPWASCLRGHQSEERGARKIQAKATPSFWGAGSCHSFLILGWSRLTIGLKSWHRANLETTLAEPICNEVEMKSTWTKNFHWSLTHFITGQCDTLLVFVIYWLSCLLLTSLSISKFFEKKCYFALKLEIWNYQELLLRQFDLVLWPSTLQPSLITPVCPGPSNCVCFAGAPSQLMRMHINLVNMQQWHTVVERGKGADRSTCNLHF